MVAVWPRDRAHPGSCYGHLDRDERETHRAERARRAALPGWGAFLEDIHAGTGAPVVAPVPRDTPACWDWPVLDEVPELVRLIGLTDHWAARARLISLVTGLFVQGRCGICGTTDAPHVDDHDHDSGRRRGPLCRSCNQREGRSDALLFRRYRERYPLLIVGIDDGYTGIGWDDGEPAAGWIAYSQAADRWRDNAMRGVL